MKHYPAFLMGKIMKGAKTIVSPRSVPGGECDNEQP